MSYSSRYVNYTAISTTDTFHNSPRFGHTSDFSDLFSNNEDQQNDYIKGIIFTGVLIFSFFLVWLVVLLIFKCLGQRNVGLLSGARMVDPDVSSGKSVCSRPNVVRLIFTLSTILVITFTGLLVSKGLTNLKNTTNSLDQTNSRVSSILAQFQGIAADLRSVGANASSTRTQILSSTDNICPNYPSFVTNNGVDLKAAGQNAAALLQLLGDFIDSKVSDAQTQLTKAQRTTNDVHSALEKFDFRKLSLAFVIIYIILPSIFLVGVLLAWFGFSNPCIHCMLSWLFLPMWVIMVIVAIFCCALASWMVIANADFCAGGQGDTPDATVQEILAKRNVTQASFLGQVVYFYITQCRASDPWAFVQSYQLNLTSANDTVAQLSSDLNTAGLDTLQGICGKDFTPFQSLLSSMSATMATLLYDAALALQLLSCDNIVPIYTNTVYNTSCQYSITALSWCFAAFLVISFFGMIMITLRSAWHDVMYNNDYAAKNNVEENPYQDSVAPPDDENAPPHWNSYSKPETVADYGNGISVNDDDKRHVHYEDKSHDDYSADLASYQDDGQHHVVYYDEPQVVRSYDDGNAKNNNNNGMYRSSAY